MTSRFQIHRDEFPHGHIIANWGTNARTNCGINLEGRHLVGTDTNPCTMCTETDTQ